MYGRRLYLYEIDGRGPGPRRGGGAILAPRRQGRGYKAKPDNTLDAYSYDEHCLYGHTLPFLLN
jgi:hypothetical protein